VLLEAGIRLVSGANQGSGAEEVLGQVIKILGSILAEVKST